MMTRSSTRDQILVAACCLAMALAATACDKGKTGAAAEPADQSATKASEAAATAAAKKEAAPAAAKKEAAPAAAKKEAAPAKPATTAKAAAPAKAPAPAKAAPKEAAAPGAAPSAALLDPSRATAEAPAAYKVKFQTTAGDFVIEVTRAWSPKGADRFYNLVKVGFYDNVAFFRVIKGFMAQFGLHGDPKITAAWRDAKITDDPVKASNTRGMVTFATSGPNTRTTQLFINFGNNDRLDGMGFSPFGKVVEADMAVVDKINGQYGEGAPRGKGPAQGLIQAQGNKYLKDKYPGLDYIKTITLLP